MSDEKDNGRPTAPGGRQPLTLKPRLGAGSVSAGTVKQSFSHGRSKTVVVETKRARTLGSAPGNLAGPSPAERRTAPPAAPVPRPAASSAPVDGNLSADELKARQRAIELAREHQARQAVEAQAQAERAARAEAASRAAEAVTPPSATPEASPTSAPVAPEPSVQISAPQAPAPQAPAPQAPAAAPPRPSAEAARAGPDTDLRALPGTPGRSSDDDHLPSRASGRPVREYQFRPARPANGRSAPGSSGPGPSPRRRPRRPNRARLRPRRRTRPLLRPGPAPSTWRPRRLPSGRAPDPEDCACRRPGRA
jgi:translation initiation factor IF-2